MHNYSIVSAYRLKNNLLIFNFEGNANHQDIHIERVLMMQCISKCSLIL